MSCKDDIAKLLPWYVTGTLSKEEHDKVEAHVKACPMCRRDVKEIQWLSDCMEKYPSILPAEHIAPEMLVLYAEARGELRDAEIAHIERHLTHCVDCSEELNTLLKVDADLKEVSLLSRLRGFLRKLFSKPETSTAKGSFGATLGKLVLRPGFAYIVVLLLLYPAWLGLRNAFFQKRAPLVNTFLLEETLTFRGSVQDGQKITISPSVDVIHLTFWVPISNSDCQYDVDLFLGENSVLTQKNLKALDDRGKFSVFLPAKPLIPGQYQLKVSEICPEAPHRPEEFLFAFELLKR